MDHPTSCCRAVGSVSAYCDLLVGLSGYRVIGVARGPDGLVVRVESPAGLGRTLRKRKDAFLAYFTTGATNGGTEAINGLIELHRRLARGFKNRSNYRLRMLLIGGGLNL